MSNTQETSSKSITFIPILIIAGLFFIFGFVTWINGALIPFMKTINELTDAQSYLVASASYLFVKYFYLKKEKLNPLSSTFLYFL